MTRRLALLAAIAAAAFALMFMRRTVVVVDEPRLTYIATAHQLGVVGYRDPAGVISRDGSRIAYSEGRHLYEELTTGGARVELAEAGGQIRHVAAGSEGEWIFEDTATSPRWWIAQAASPKRPLFATAAIEVSLAGSTRQISVDALRQLSLSPDARAVVAIASSQAGADILRIALDLSRSDLVHAGTGLASPAWTATGEVACIVTTEGRPRLSAPCGQPSITFEPDVDLVGPLAFASASPVVFFASPNPSGMVDLWSGDLCTRAAKRVTSFSRDSYAPSLAADGRVMFKVQSYRTAVAELDLASGMMRQLATLQAETPSYHPDGRRIAVTYGTWRRVIDDAKYPDIAQEIGVIRGMPIASPATEPVEVIAKSDSEDQAMTWSPNGKWIAFHSHREQSDDIWLRPVDGGSPDRRISFLGRGAEVGWPRWSPDGKWVLYDGASPVTGRSVPFVIGVDQETGRITAEPREVQVSGVDGEITHGEWLPDSMSIAVIVKTAPGQHAIAVVPAAGGDARVVHQFRTEHDFPGLAVEPDGNRVAFIAPAPDGFFQVFALPLGGGTPEQLTTDRSHKTQPAWSPDGGRLAFTVWSYEAQFWTLAAAR